jgi:hypothetical protein
VNPGSPPDDDGRELSRLAARVDDLTAIVTRLAADLEDLSAAVLPDEFTLADHGPPTDPSPEAAGRGAAGPGAEVVQPVYPDLDAWVRQFFVPTFHRPVGGEIRWCSRWPDHAEAITRLTALWRSWEAMRLDPNLGMATWLTSFLDPQLAVLLSRSGTFAQCTPDRHADHQVAGMT